MRKEKEIRQEHLAYLSPKDTINITGLISYKERIKAFGLIQLRREIVDVFPQLRERRGSFAYTMFYNRSHKELKKIMENFEKKDLVPILLFLGRVKEETPDRKT